MALTELDARALQRWAVATRADLAAYAEPINRLNVFPVPDADTGTNLLMTLDTALNAMSDVAEAEPTNDGVVRSARALADATLMAARGNSGVILSQLVRGVAEVVTERAGEPLTGVDVAAFLRRASDYAWRGVTRPLDGTILSVAAAAAQGAEQSRQRDVAPVVEGAARAAQAALLATRDQLPQLRDAGVVDAGGAGYLLSIEALRRVVQGDPGLAVGAPTPVWLTEPARTSATPAAGHGAGCGAPVLGGPAYEVMYLVQETTDSKITDLRGRLDELGDSLVVVGGPELWSVHVHVDDVDAAIDAGSAAGAIHRIEVTRFADQVARTASATTGAAPTAAATTPGAGVQIVASVSGDGLRRLCSAEGAHVIQPADDGPVTFGDITRAVEAAGPSVVVLADSPEVRGMAREVANAIAAQGISVTVPPCESSPQVLAGLAVHAGSVDAGEAAQAIAEAISEVRTGAVLAPHGEHSQYVAIVGEQPGTHDTDPSRVALSVIDTLMRDGGELVTVVTGAAAAAEVVHTIEVSVRRRYRSVDLTVIDGGAATPYLAVGVE